MSFKIFSSNRLEILAEELVNILGQPVLSPLEGETIVVQSRGMERWLSLQIARQLGICANIRFPFPNAFVYDIMKTVLSMETDAIARSDGINALPEKSIYDPKYLTWKIMQLLPESLDRAEFADLKRYLEAPASNVKRLQLSVRIADLFDQYLLFRPEMVLKWETGKERHWQAELWRAATRGAEALHRAAMVNSLLETFAHSSKHFPELPQRISVFGISALPEFHIRIFAALGKFMDVNLFLMNPCKEYWGDIASNADLRRAARKKPNTDPTLDLFHFDKGNSLLASTGRLGRDFFDLIEEKVDYEPNELFVEPGETSLLTCLQSDILNLRDRSLTGAPKKPIDEMDGSLQVHSCHSIRREIELLQDYLLNLFEQHANLKPSDIIVMAPDIEPYAPYIEAVFDLPFEDLKRIPYSIADRSYSKENDLVETFLVILGLPGSRFGAAQVLAILETPSVQKKFELSEDDLELIHHWVRETRIRWGRDAKARHELGLPELTQNTWRAGLERLLLGYALPADDQRMYQDILPYDHIEGRQAAVLGKFLEFTHRLFEKTDSLARKRSLAEWHTELRQVLETFFAATEETAVEFQVILQTLAEFDEIRQVAQFEEKPDIQVIRHYLQNKLTKEGHSYGFLTGGVTFCSMLPMRSIPAQVICLIGMNSDAYPRSTKQLGFDLMARQPRKGDRSRRNDDRYLFLEALLSARDKLYISYVGQSIKDNSIIPPSVLVSELLDYIDANFQMANQQILKQITIRHHLQAFSPEYFKGNGKLFSYSEENLAAARTLLQPRTQTADFIRADLSEPDAEFKTVDLMDLYRFFRNPIRFLFNKRLGLYLDEGVVLLEEKESFNLRGLERYQIAEELVQQFLEQKDVGQWKIVKNAAGQLPHGAVGDYEFDTLSTKVRNFAEKTASKLASPKSEPLQVELKVGEFLLRGQIEDFYDHGITLYRYARVRAKDHLRAWLFHLVLNSVISDKNRCRSLLIGVDSDDHWQCYQLHPTEKSREILSELLRIYWQGLCKPLRFFPDSAWTYIRELVGNENRLWYPLWRAAKTWHGSDYERGECQDPYFNLLFGKEKRPFDSEFQRLAASIYQPILHHEEEIA